MKVVSGHTKWSTEVRCEECGAPFLHDELWKDDGQPQADSGGGPVLVDTDAIESGAARILDICPECNAQNYTLVKGINDEISDDIVCCSCSHEWMREK